MMNGLLVYRQIADHAKQKTQLETIIRAFQQWRLTLFAVTIQDINRLLETSSRGFFKFAILLDDETQIARYLQMEHRIKVYNDESSMNFSIDRALLSISLRNALISSPATIALPFVVNVNIMQAIHEVKAMMQDILYPVLIKNRYPQPQEKIYFARDEKELIKTLQPIGMKPLIVQAYVPPENRQMFKVLTIGSKVYAGIEVVTVNQQDYLKQVKLPPSVSKIALKTAKTLGATYALISVFYLNNKDPYVYSVKTNPDIVELQVVTGIYLSWYLARHIYQQVKKLK
jgi:glutathione synthase/RimK-type ligase-like ATP-grasp enzyme